MGQTRTVITALFTGFPDPQSGKYWPADVRKLTVLDSIRRHGWHAVVINDCLDESDTDDVTYVKVDNNIPNAYWARWRWIEPYLLTHAARIDWVWCVDGGDVIMLNNPAGHMEPDRLYIGSEPTDGPNKRTVGFWWMRQLHPDHASWIDRHADDQLLNCGIVGGDVRTVSAFAAAVNYGESPNDKTDMARANVVARTFFEVETGPPVHTPMWSFRTSDPQCWWAHK